MGVIVGFTGPIESLTPDMGGSAEVAFKEASDSGLLLGGQKIVSVRADSTCIDNAAATAAAERLVTAEKVVGIMGADCSGVTTAVANNVAVPNGVPMISPSATSPALTTIADNGYFFRTAPSDARQGQVLASIPSVLKNFRSMAKISTILFQEEERKIILKRIYRSVANMVLIQTERNFAFATITFPFRSMTSQILLVNAIENIPCRSQCGANCLTILVRPVKAKIIYLPDIKKDPHILQEELQEFSGRELPSPSLASPLQGLLPKKQEKVEQVRRILKAWETYPTSSFISKTKMVIKLKTEKTPGTSLKMWRAIASQATRNLSKKSSS